MKEFRTAIQAVLAQRISDLMRARDWSQSELAEKAGVDQTTVAKAMSGDRWLKPAIVEKIAKALCVPSWSLFVPATGPPGHSDGAPNTPAEAIPNEPLEDTLRRRIRARMEELNLSLVVVARRAGMSADGLKKIIYGQRRPRYENLEAIAEALATRPWKLLLPEEDERNLGRLPLDLPQDELVGILCDRLGFERPKPRKGPQT